MWHRWCLNKTGQARTKFSSIFRAGHGQDTIFVNIRPRPDLTHEWTTVTMQDSDFQLHKVSINLKSCIE